MADEGNEDSWLYGNEKDETDDLHQTIEDNNEEVEEIDIKPELGNEIGLDATDNQMQVDDDGNNQEEDMGGDEEGDGQNEEGDGEDEDDEDSDDDDHINIVIGDIKSGPSYSIKQRGPIIPQAANAATEKAKQSAGKFSIEEFESVGTINGVPAHEFSIDSLEDKPWRKPGADITDYFNYGFNEETWRAYCERQKRMRIHESGVGLTSLTANNPQAAQHTSNDNSKYGNPAFGGIRRIGGPPPQRRMNGSIDVIGGGNLHSRRDSESMPNPKENVIQVMTADRREYSRTVVGNKFDSTIPPPQFENQNMGGPDFYGIQNQDAYGGMYEPTQDSQWMNDNSNWQPSGIKTLTPGPMMAPMGPPGMHPGMMNMGPPDHMQMPPPMNPMGGMGPGGRDRDRDRRDDRERDYRERDRDRLRDRDRDGRRDRDRRDTRDRDMDRDRVVIKTEPVDTDTRSSREESQTKDRERDKDRRSKSDRSTSSRKERSRSRERSKSKRRSRSRDRSRERERRDRDKKTSKSSSSSTTSSSTRKEEKEASATTAE